MPPKRNYNGLPTGKKVTMIQGYMQGDPERIDEEDFADDDDDFDFVASAGTIIERKELHKTKVQIQKLDESGRYTELKYVRGKFPFYGQHWHVTVEIKEGNTAAYSQGIPVYRFRSDLGSRQRIFTAFLRRSLAQYSQSSKQDAPEVKEFTSYVESRRIPDLSPYYRVENLLQLVEECAEAQPTVPLKENINQLQGYITGSEVVHEVNCAIQNPLVMSKLPVLMPRDFLNIIRHDHQKSTYFLRKLEIMLAKSPWELAFSYMTFTKTGVYLPEVKYTSFEKAFMWNNMSQPYRDAIMMYHVLKDHCRETGDTYMSKHRLNGQSSRFKGYFLSRFHEALEYLEAAHAIVVDDDRVYLKRLHDSEANIAYLLNKYMKADEQLTFTCHFESEPLDVLAGDPDQKRASEMIARNAVTAMSGRGGCGKTEVVSRVCQVALEQVYKLRREEHQAFHRERLERIAAKQEEMRRQSELERLQKETDAASATTSTDKCEVKLESSRDTNQHLMENPPGADQSLKLEPSVNQSSEPQLNVCRQSVKQEPSVNQPMKQEPDDLSERSAVEPGTLVKLETNVAVESKPMEQSNYDSDETNWSEDETTLEITDPDKADAELKAQDTAESQATDINSCQSEPETMRGTQILEEESEAHDNPQSLLASMICESGREWDSIVEERGPASPDDSLKSYILLSAPTGKAAKVLGRRTGYPAYTLHQVIWRYILWKRSPEHEFVPAPFSEVAILVVDECSLVGVANLSFLMTVLDKLSKLKKVIFLGDLQQLPSIEPGNFLTDLYSALSAANAAVTLSTNHRSEGRLIVENAINISANIMPTFDTTRQFSLVVINAEYAELERDLAVEKLITEGDFRDDKKSQLVAFRRLDCEAVNNICSKHYIGSLCINPTTKAIDFANNMKISCSHNGTVKVIVVKEEPKPTRPKSQSLNTSVPQVADLLEEDGEDFDRLDISDTQLLNQLDNEGTGQLEQCSGSAPEQTAPDRNDRPEEKPNRSRDMRLCNGEIFWIVAMFDKEETLENDRKRSATYWTLQSEDDLVISVKRKEFIKECRPKPAWCRTIHTFQGSEIDHLGYIVGAAGRQNWQHVYTAVTRGKKSVTIIGDEESLRRAIKTPALKRFCSLEEKLKVKLDIPFTRLCVDTEDRKQQIRSYPDPLRQTNGPSSRQGGGDEAFNDMLEDWDDSDYEQVVAVSVPSKRSKVNKRDHNTEAAFEAFNSQIRHGFTSAANVLDDEGWDDDCTDELMMRISSQAECSSGTSTSSPLVRPNGSQLLASNQPIPKLEAPSPIAPVMRRFTRLHCDQSGNQ